MSYFNHSSQRLDFRKNTLDDIDDWTEFFVDNPNLPFLGLKEEEDKQDQSRIWIERQLTRYTETGVGHLALIDRELGEMIGQAGLLKKELEELGGKTVFEIGYSIKPRFWRKGYATEAALHLKEFALQNRVAPHVISMIHQDNIGSQKVAQTNGMSIEHTLIHKNMPIYIFGIQLY